MVDTYNLQAAGTHIVLDEVGVYLVTEFQLQLVGKRL